jgi:dTDP-4-amino-4,6-dideoxygalactose transaminase
LRELTVALTALAQSALGRPEVYGVPAAIPWLHLGETRYCEPQEPRGMSRTAAALLERTLPLATREAGLRRANGEALLHRLASRSDTRAITPPTGGTPGFLRLPVRLQRGLDGFTDPVLARRLGVAAGYPSTLAALPPLQRHLARAGRWPGAEELVRELVTLPTHSLVSEGDRDRLVRLFELGA